MLTFSVSTTYLKMTKIFAKSFSTRASNCDKAARERERVEHLIESNFIYLCETWQSSSNVNFHLDSRRALHSLPFHTLNPPPPPPPRSLPSMKLPQNSAQHSKIERESSDHRPWNRASAIQHFSGREVQGQWNLWMRRFSWANYIFFLFFGCEKSSSYRSHDNWI